MNCYEKNQRKKITFGILHYNSVCIYNNIMFCLFICVFIAEGLLISWNILFHFK